MFDALFKTAVFRVITELEVEILFGKQEPATSTKYRVHKINYIYLTKKTEHEHSFINASSEIVGTALITKVMSFLHPSDP